jgi:hypothetical protein
MRSARSPPKNVPSAFIHPTTIAMNAGFFCQEWKIHFLYIAYVHKKAQRKRKIEVFNQSASFL